MRGHAKLFMLEMDLERSKKPIMTEDVGIDACRNAAYSMQHIFLPSLKAMSGR